MPIKVDDVGQKEMAELCKTIPVISSGRTCAEVIDGREVKISDISCLKSSGRWSRDRVR